MHSSAVQILRPVLAWEMATMLGFGVCACPPCAGRIGTAWALTDPAFWVTACSFSPLCIDVPTLKGGVEEGKRAVMRMARGLLRDVLDVGHREDAHESNIMPLAGELVKGAGRERRDTKSLLGRYFQ